MKSQDGRVFRLRTGAGRCANQAGLNCSVVGSVVDSMGYVDRRQKQLRVAVGLLKQTRILPGGWRLARILGGLG